MIGDETADTSNIMTTQYNTDLGRWFARDAPEPKQRVCGIALHTTQNRDAFQPRTGLLRFAAMSSAT